MPAIGISHVVDGYQIGHHCIETEWRAENEKALRPGEPLELPPAHFAAGAIGTDQPFSGADTLGIIGSHRKTNAVLVLLHIFSMGAEFDAEIAAFAQLRQQQSRQFEPLALHTIRMAGMIRDIAKIELGDDAILLRVVLELR